MTHSVTPVSAGRPRQPRSGDAVQGPDARPQPSGRVARRLTYSRYANKFKGDFITGTDKATSFDGIPPASQNCAAGRIGCGLFPGGAPVPFHGPGQPARNPCGPATAPGRHARREVAFDRVQLTLFPKAAPPWSSAPGDAGQGLRRRPRSTCASSSCRLSRGRVTADAVKVRSPEILLPLTRSTPAPAARVSPTRAC